MGLLTLGVGVGVGGFVGLSLMLAATSPGFALSRTVVDHLDGGGTPPDLLVWSAGALPKRRRVVHAVRDRAFFAWSR